jgi:hypothetical protein
MKARTLIFAVCIGILLLPIVAGAASITTRAITPQLLAPREDCISFNPQNVEVRQINGRWKVVEGNMWMLDFGANEVQARKALAVIKHYRMNSQCFVGRPGPSMQYYLVNGRSPVGAFRGEDAIPFDPSKIQVTSIGGRWKIVEGSHWIMDFESSEAEARTAFSIIQKYGFNRICFVGRPNPPMTYFRVEPSIPTIKAELTAAPPRFTGKCPTTINFKGTISVSQACDVKYKFVRSDGGIAPENTLKFTAPGAKPVSTTWQIGRDYAGWEAVQVLSPVSVQSNKAAFDIKCAPAIAEDCISFDWQKAEVKQINGSWKIVVGTMWLLDFASSESEARRALQIITYYKMNSQCFVGRPNPGMEYYKVNGASPQGALAGEDAIAFDPAHIQAQQISGTWKVVEGSHWILDFGSSQANANKALQIIQNYGFTKICYVGRPGASMTYFRK